MIKSELENSIYKIGELKEFQIKSFSSRFGGSINEVFLLDTSEGKYILKLNDLLRYPGMFDSEKEGLQALGSTMAIDVPEVVGVGHVDTTAYLLLEFKPEAPQHPDFEEIFGKNLADLHKNTSENFGFRTPNYIGSLPQYNEECPTAAEFFLSQRLEPQFKMAADNGFSFASQARVMKNIESAIPDEAPSLIHGDLWAGNHLVNDKGLPCLIDPAVSFGPREMDLAMMKLFGGFSEEIFRAYNSHFPLPAGFEERISLWQLYYLLVHLNLFGTGYLNSVNRILHQYG